MKYDTIKQYLSGIKHFYLKYNIRSPFDSSNTLNRLQLILRGVKRSQINVRKERLPITFAIYKHIIGVLNEGFLGEYNSTMLAAACGLAFFGFMRCGEFTSMTYHYQKDVHLNISDVAFDSDNSSYLVFLKCFKDRHIQVWRFYTRWS